MLDKARMSFHIIIDYANLNNLISVFCDLIRILFSLDLCDCGISGLILL